MSGLLYVTMGHSAALKRNYFPNYMHLIPSHLGMALDFYPHSTHQQKFTSTSKLFTGLNVLDSPFVSKSVTKLESHFKSSFQARSNL